MICQFILKLLVIFLLIPFLNSVCNKIDKLYTLTTSGNLIEETLTRLRSEGYLNNNKYLDSFIRDRINLTVYGPNRIKSNLINNQYTHKGENKYDETLNKKLIDENGELINSVFMLDSSKYFYKNNIGTVITGNYNDITLQPAFSSLSFAKSYVKYYEYQEYIQ